MNNLKKYHKYNQNGKKMIKFQYEFVERHLNLELHSSCIKYVQLLTKTFNLNYLFEF